METESDADGFFMKFLNHEAGIVSKSLQPFFQGIKVVEPHIEDGISLDDDKAAQGVFAAQAVEVLVIGLQFFFKHNRKLFHIGTDKLVSVFLDLSLCLG